MGFIYRKSVHLGSFRVNLIKSSVGHSVGGRGFGSEVIFGNL